MEQKTNLNLEFEEQLGYNTSTIMSLFSHFSEVRKRSVEGLWKVLDALDSGDFWEITKDLVPKHSLKPDTNWVNYVKTSLTNSLYTGTYRGDVSPRITGEKHKFLARNLNKFLEYEFDKIGFMEYLIKSGDRASLLNLGALEVGWNPDIIDRVDKLFQGDIELRYVDPMALFLDPGSIDPHMGRALFIADEISTVELLNTKRFKKRMTEYLKSKEDKQDSGQVGGLPSYDPREYGRGYHDQRARESKDGTVRLLTCYYKYQPENSDGYRIDRLWLVDDGFILGVQKDLRPKTFPVRILYATPPIKDPYGTPICKLILKNVITLNIIESVEATNIWASQKRPKVVRKESGINEVQFAIEGNNPDKVWIVNGRPEDVLKYIDLPELPSDRHLLKQELKYAIMRVTGVDDRYTGRDTGSVQTTGGMDIMNQRISMSDNTRIAQLQIFIKEITKLILSFFIEHGGEKRNFPIYNQARKVDAIGTINFKELKDIGFDFSVNVTPHLPNNVMRRAAAADMIMEKQAQYGMNPPIMTAEEWLEAQDFPQKYEILERIQKDRMVNDQEEVMADIVNFAGMTQQGMSPESAINQLAQERQLKREQPGIGNVAGGSIQARQG